MGCRLARQSLLNAPLLSVYSGAAANGGGRHEFHEHCFYVEKRTPGRRSAGVPPGRVPTVPPAYLRRTSAVPPGYHPVPPPYLRLFSPPYLPRTSRVPPARPPGAERLSAKWHSAARHGTQRPMRAPRRSRMGPSGRFQRPLM